MNIFNLNIPDKYIYSINTTSYLSEGKVYTLHKNPLKTIHPTHLAYWREGDTCIVKYEGVETIITNVSFAVRKLTFPLTKDFLHYIQFFNGNTIIPYELEFVEDTVDDEIPF